MPNERQSNPETERLRPGSTLVRLAVDERWGAHVRMTHDNTEFVMRGSSMTPNRIFSPDEKIAKKAHGRVTVGPGIHVYSSINEGTIHMGTWLGYLGLYVQDIPENAPQQPRTRGLVEKRQKIAEHTPQVIYEIDAEQEEITMAVHDRRGRGEFVLYKTSLMSELEREQRRLDAHRIQAVLSTPINREASVESGAIQISDKPALGIYVSRRAHEALTFRT